jgi:hypothetical protein
MKKIHIILLLALFLISSSWPARSAPTGSAAAIAPALPVKGKPKLLDPVCIDQGCALDGLQFNYLIVTRPKFVDALAPFISWKTENGFRVGLVTVEWLEASYPGRHLAEKMKTGIHTLRNSAGVMYVLLVGDTEIKFPSQVVDVLNSYTLLVDYNVPTGYYRRLDSDPYKEVLPSDSYFVEARDWDPDNTTLNPRPDNRVSGEGTLHADLYVGRWPVREASQVSLLTEKNRQVTTTDRIFFSADRTFGDGVGTVCPSWPPVSGYEFFCYSDSMVTARTRFFEANAPHLVTESMFVDLTDPVQTSALRDRLLTNRGVIVLNYHGWYECLQIQPDCVPGSDIRFEYVFPLLEGEACMISAFYYDGGTSFSETMLLSSTGPAVFTQAPNATLFLNELKYGTSVGKAFWGTAAAYVSWSNPMLLLGDPSLVVFSTP